ncbi:unnamed protein product [Ixodes pacificus]
MTLLCICGERRKKKTFKVTVTANLRNGGRGESRVSRYRPAVNANPALAQVRTPKGPVTKRGHNKRRPPFLKLSVCITSIESHAGKEDATGRRLMNSVDANMNV